MENDSQEMITICRICRGKQSKLYATKGGYCIYLCSTCRTFFLHPLPEPRQSASVYEEGYFSGASEGYGYANYDADKEAMRRVFEDYIHRLDRYVSKRGSLLDVGAATGFFMSIAQGLGWDVYGIEISKYASSLARKKGLRVITGAMAEAPYSSETFDVVTMFDVIEHVHDPHSELAKVYSLLKPQGLLVINTPDSGSLYAKLMGRRWLHFIPPEHIYQFNRRSIRMILEHNHFEVLEIGCIGKNFTLAYIVQTLYHWQKIPLWKSIYSFLKKYPRIGNISISLNLRDNMFVIARKNDSY